MYCKVVKGTNSGINADVVLMLRVWCVNVCQCVVVWGLNVVVVLITVVTLPVNAS